MTDNEIIRDVERKYLDEEYKNYKLIQLTDNISTLYILKKFGDISRDFNSLDVSNFAKSQELFYFLHGIGHCIRWISSKNESIDRKEYSFDELDNFALKLILWSKEYASIANQHIAWSRGIINAKVDNNIKKISFLPPTEKEMQFNLIQDFAANKSNEYFSNTMPFELMHKSFFDWKKHVKTDNYLIQIDWEIVKESPVSKIMQEELKKTVLPELISTTDIGGYTINDFIIFFTNLFIYFYFIVTIENEIDLKTDFKNPFGSVPLFSTKPEMISFLIECTGLPELVVKEILSDLTFDTENFHTNILIQPFVKTKSNEYLVLPRLLTHCEPERMLIGAMNKKKKKKQIYDKLINLIEKWNLNLICELLKNWVNDLEITKDKSITIGSKTITPDFIIKNHKTKEILICDYKNFITPISASETHYKIIETKKAINQVQKYIDFFIENNYFKMKIDYQIYGLILVKNPIPIPIASSNILITDLISFKKSLKETITINELLQEVDNIKIKDKEFKFENIETKVQGWIYSREIFVAD